MITIEIAIELHNDLIDLFGGSKGVRDKSGLEAAVARPYMTFDQQELYPSAFEKAAAILESLIINHPFIDGNKRIAYTLMQLILLDYGFHLAVTENEQYDFVIAASTGQIRFDEIKAWLQTNTSPIS
jgi:death-on-curing protein